MSDFQSAATCLLRECFEGRPIDQPYTWFVEGREAILPTLDATDADTASIKPNEMTSSIAGHAYHILYALRGANAQRTGAATEGTWEDSWKEQAASAAEWDEVRARIREEYSSLVKWFEENEDWSPEQIHVGALAMLPHMAFHLGAIQQIVRFTKQVN
ncbi:MAG: DinB family protein [Fimbriimonadaceae bacterium]